MLIEKQSSTVWGGFEPNESAEWNEAYAATSAKKILIGHKMKKTKRKQLEPTKKTLTANHVELWTAKGGAHEFWQNRSLRWYINGNVINMHEKGILNLTPN